jgi:hypothetical protein
MEFTENILSSLPASFYFMVALTIVPMAVQIPRLFTLVYLVVYALAGAWLVFSGIPERQAKNSKNVGAKMDDRLSLFARIKLQDP